MFKNNAIFASGIFKSSQKDQPHSPLMAAKTNIDMDLEYLTFANRLMSLEQEVAAFRTIFGQINLATKITNENEPAKDTYPTQTAGPIINAMIRGEAITLEQYDNIIAFSNTDTYSNALDFIREIIVAFKKLVTKHCATDEGVADMKFPEITKHLKEIANLSNAKERKSEKNTDKKKELLKIEKAAVRKYCVTHIGQPSA